MDTTAVTTSSMSSSVTRVGPVISLSQSSVRQTLISPVSSRSHSNVAAFGSPLPNPLSERGDPPRSPTSGDLFLVIRGHRGVGGTNTLVRDTRRTKPLTRTQVRIPLE